MIVLVVITAVLLIIHVCLVLASYILCKNSKLDEKDWILFKASTLVLIAGPSFIIYLYIQYELNSKSFHTNKVV